MPVLIVSGRLFQQPKTMNASFLVVLLLLVLFTTVTIVLGDSVPEVNMTEEEIRRTLDGMSLAMLVNILEEQGVYLGDNYYSKEELIDYIIQLAESDRRKDRTSKPASQLNSAKQSATKTDSTSQNSKAAATSNKPLSIWEQFKDQVRRDFSPYLMIVPQPIKKYLAHMLPKLRNTVAQLLRGAMVPMLHVAVQALRRAGQLLVAASTRLESVLSPPAETMSSWS